MVAEVADGHEKTFGRYQLRGLIGQGGMGKVFRAWDPVLQRDVAIKVLSIELAEEPNYRERFRRETLITAGLNDPHIIPVFDSGAHDEQLYLVMAVIDGVDLQTLLDRDGPMNPQRAVQVIEQVASALDTAHAAGLVHRDVKPSNVLLTDRQHAYLIDFGIAHDSRATKITRTGGFVGTAAYMAPERLGAGKIDARGDVYSLTCALYECLTGQSPFPGDSLEQQITAHLTQPPPSPSAQLPGVPARFDGVVARGMAKDPEQRYQTAGELAAAANQALSGARSTVSLETAPHVPNDSAPATYVSYATVPPGGSEPPRTADNPDIMAWPAYDGDRTSAPPAISYPPTPPPPTLSPTVVGVRRRSRRAMLEIVFGAAAVIAVIVAALAIRPIVGHKASQPMTSPQSHGPSRAELPLTGLNHPSGVAVDNTGAVYVADSASNRILKLGPGASAPTTLPFLNLQFPNAVAVDSAGDVYITQGVGRTVPEHPVQELVAGASHSIELTVFPGGQNYSGVAVDAAGNLYVTTSGDRLMTAGASRKPPQVLKLASGAHSNPTVLPFTGLAYPWGVAVDSAGAVYVVNANEVLKLAAGSSAATELPVIGGLQDPKGIAVDDAGNVYIADDGAERVIKLPAGSSIPQVLPFSSLSNPQAVAIDTRGNIYVADRGNDRVLKLPAQ